MRIFWSSHYLRREPVKPTFHMPRIFLLLLLSGISVAAQTGSTDFAGMVNPMIGTGGHGHTYPGALVPYGMMQLSPDTRLSGWDGCSGYHYSDTAVYGFSHTHLSGTGCSDYGDILITPSNTLERSMPYRFSHKREKASPGYYRVFLDDPGINAELTSTARCGMHRYTFSGPERFIHINLKHRDEVLDSKLEIVDSVTLRGYRFSKAWASNQKVFFEIRFSKPIWRVTDAASHNARPLRDAAVQRVLTGKDIQECYQFRNNKEPLLIKVAISAVDEEGAHKNMQAEMPGWNFEKYRNDARRLWNNELSKLEVSGGTTDQRMIFYTSLYHCMSAPNIYSDVDHRYRGRDDRIHSTDGKFDYYTVFSLWDTHRGEHPLLTLIDKRRTNDFINTFIRQYEEGGRLPVWELSSNETECMIGYHAVPVIWDAYSKGIRNYDVQKAYEAMKHSAMMDHFGLASYKKYGLVRSDDEGESVSKTLEYAYDDWCIAQMAKALNRSDDYDYFMKRAQSWKNVFDPTTGFMRPRNNGMLYASFSPYTVDNNFTEANSWQYSFYVPHDIPGLITALGGKAAFERKLDDLFHARQQTEGREQADMTGLIGQYVHGNEPSHHIAYLYNYVGKPEKSRKIIKQVMDSFYHNTPDGLIGNEDCGQMSAWYVLSALGFYPVCPGLGNTYEPGYRLFNSVRLSDETGYRFDIPGSGPGTPVLFPSHTDDHAERSTIVPAPFIADARKVFKGSELIRLGCLDKNAAIYFALDKGVFRKYDLPFSITAKTHIDFYSKNGAMESAFQSGDFTRLPDDRNIVLHSIYNKQYTAGGPEGLIDGLHGTTNWRSGGWQGYQGQDFEGIVAFQQRKKINKIKANFLEDQNAWIFYPRTISFYASDDSVHWELVETMPTNKPDHFTRVTTSTFSSSKPLVARFVKVVATSFGAMPDWHEGRGEQTFMFIDEIEVE